MAATRNDIILGSDKTMIPGTCGACRKAIKTSSDTIVQCNKTLLFHTINDKCDVKEADMDNGQIPESGKMTMGDAADILDPKTSDLYFYNHGYFESQEKTDQWRADVDRACMLAAQTFRQREEARRICREALGYFGASNQILKLFEEMAELQKEVCKHEQDLCNLDEIAEELADVSVILEQMAILFQVEELTEQIRLEKLERLEGRIREKAGEPEENAED